MTGGPGARGPRAENRPTRAVIDIGSNTVRLVVYSGSTRAPDVWLNEKATARLGRDLAAGGAMPDKALGEALKALSRFATILADHGISDVETVATAAVRESANGAEFLEQVRAIGLSPRLLSGDEEAETAALGVIGAFPHARGTVADLGGGSLELVAIGEGRCRDAASLPLGTLLLPAMRARGGDGFRKAVGKELDRAGWSKPRKGQLYMVGGTWRALAVYTMRSLGHPLTDPHGFVLDPADAERLAKQVARMEPAALAAVPGVPSSRAAGLPDAAAMLRVILGELQPGGVTFSSWGLREGLLYRRLPPAVQAQDPLFAAVSRFAAPRGGAPADAAMIAAWTAGAVQAGEDHDERLRLAATILAMAAVRIEPNLRARHAYDWAMDKRWIGLDPVGRARLAAALLAACGKIAPPPELERIAGWDSLREAVGWGLALRLFHRLGAGSRMSLLTSRLRRQDDSLVLWLDSSRAQLASDSVVSDLRNLAHWLALEPELRIGERPEGWT